ncbi:hypothetical protein AB0L53_49935 [Nonomuraea sp. NPDC052129]|uniref:hypothetical protein n=1 Tax=Nonomuraea sp. NPDC052129 TaxID=3154651 RepID=UPI00341758BF
MSTCAPPSCQRGRRRRSSGTRRPHTAHRALGCSGYSRSDFVVADGDQVWWLETNTLPGLSATGNMATMAAADGIGYDALITFILSTALTPHGYRP